MCHHSSMATMFYPSNHCLLSLPLKVPRRVLISPLSTVSLNPKPMTSLSSSLFVKPSETTLGCTCTRGGTICLTLLYLLRSSFLPPPQRFNGLFYDSKSLSKYSDIYLIWNITASVLPSAAEWIIDTGATVHATADLTLLENVRDLVVPPILAADGSPLLEWTESVQKCGDVHLWGGLIILKDVRYLNIDGFKANVPSVGKLCDDSDAAVFLAGDECHILEKSSQKRVAVARKDPVLLRFVLKC